MGTRVPPPCPTPLHCDQAAMAGLPQLITDLQRLSEDQESADLVFICGREEERIYAHRILLMARCKSFKTAKRGEICRIPGCSVSPAAPGTPTPVRLPHVNPDVFRQFIVYVYTAKIMLQDSRVFEMMTLAQDMGVEELRAACEDHVISTLSVDNACTFLTSVMEIHEKAGAKCAASFMERCIIYIGENASECAKTNAFLNLTKDALVKLISSDYFCLEEEDVWRCVLAWAKNQAGVTQPTAHWTEEERARVCQHLSGVMCHVRLLLIDSQVFAEEVEPTGAVPMELSLERYRYAALHSNKGGGGVGGGQMLPSIPGMTEDDKRLQPRLTVNMFPGSQLLRNDKLHLQSVLNGWYGMPKQSWRLVFRASTHGYSSSAFHRYCDGVAPCFIIGIGSRGELSGGYTDVAWAKTSRKGGYIHSERAFLFALNPAGGDPPVKFDIIKKPYAICYHPDCGPIFGAGADLLIANNCNTNMDSYSNLPHSYDGPNAAYLTLFGDYNFTVVDYEVYTLVTNTTAAGGVMGGVSTGNNGNNSVSGNNASNNNNNNTSYSNTGNNNNAGNLSANVGGGNTAGVGGNSSGGGGAVSGGLHKPKYERY
ncbi:PREDICTED: uncharacterized protein LOC108967227 [Bactrocera latifrons]|uniref:BTB/POZ domain-containing protein 19 n=1 Tax=Bactrocera latifrons TaxID=174628 RepID=A0A0K8UIZ2_BACLA|nr:PREDICTED: uncharacterized protein LOC108967227 [Bactrocera latifrons]XP_018786063.1 PREDICTED: uncharacterized protein LOC108967227 [Bactrocera latifrons]XP_018786064.1 PREDICTED: uncharacterized protein LOC108967227 [Bactrocera latifrons]XP_018786066.1 PREDICTED: uncharacterized protein LOC108967227 [Bactrocera latifrons]